MNSTPTAMNISDITSIVTDAIPEETTTKRLAYFVFAFGMLVLTLSFLSSCNTTRGFGRDVQKVGNKIERGAVKVQSKL